MYLRTKMDASNTRLFEKLREEMLAERCGNVSTGSSRGRGGGAGGRAEGRREGEDGEERRDEAEAEGDDACGLAAVVSLAREFFFLFFSAVALSLRVVLHRCWLLAACADVLRDVDADAEQGSASDAERSTHASACGCGAEGCGAGMRSTGAACIWDSEH
jgi:hypothetical protein